MINGRIGCPYCERQYSSLHKADCVRLLRLHLIASHDILISANDIEGKIITPDIITVPNHIKKAQPLKKMNYVKDLKNKMNEMTTVF